MTGLGQVGALGRLGAPALARGGWWLSESQLDLDFANNRAFNRSTSFNGSPNGILTYTSPSPKLVYGDDGVLRYALHNLLTYSEQIDNAAWTKTDTTITANAVVAPDGTLTADKIVENTANAVHYAGQSVTVVASTVYANTVYLKKAERTKARLYYTINDFTVSILVDVDLDAGTVSAVTVNGAATSNGASITAVGDDWYRVSLAGTIGTQTAGRLRVATKDAAGNITYTGDGTSGIYIWGAQLNLGSSALTYVPTTTAAVYSLPLDHDPITHAPLGVLIEEQRTNLLTYSEQFDNAAWTKGEATVSANAATSPNGTASADKLVESVNIAEHYALQAFAVVSGTTYTCTVFAKAGERSWLRIFLGANIGNGFAWVNLATGAVGTTSGSPTVAVTDVGDGWYRIAVTKAATGTGSTSLTLLPGTADNTASYDGDGTSGLYLWGAQLEAGAFATSYIPTVASQVTRAEDQVSILTSAFAYNATELTMLEDVFFDGVNASGYRYCTGVWGGSVAEANVFTSNAGLAAVRIRTGGVDQMNDYRASPAMQGTTLKRALAAKANDCAVSYGGAAVVADATVAMPSGITTLFFAAYGSTHMKRFTLWNTRKTNAELQALSA